MFGQTPVCLCVPVLIIYQDRPIRPLYVCVFLFWFYTRTDLSDSCMSVCSYSGSIPGQTSQTPVCLCVPVLVLYQDRPVRLLYVCVFLFWFHTRTDQSDPCMSVCSCFWFYTMRDQSDPCISVCSCSGSIPGQTSQLLYVCVFLLWFYTRTDQSDPCMSVCSCSGFILGQTSQTPVCLCVPVLVLYQDRPVSSCMSVCSCSGSIPGQTSQTPVCLCVPVLILYQDRPIRRLYICVFFILVLYQDRPVRPLYVCVFLFWFYTRTDQSDPFMSVCSCSGSLPEQTNQTPVCLCVPVLVLYQDRPIRPLYVCVFLFWFYTRTEKSDPCMSVYSCSGSVSEHTSQTPVCLFVPVLFCTRTDQSDPCMSVCSCSGSIPGQTSQTPICLCVPVLVLYQNRPVPFLVLYQDRPVRPLCVCMFLFWFYTRTDQSDPCMTVCSYSRSIPGQTSQTPVCACVLILVLYQDSPVYACISVCSVLVLYPDRPVSLLYVCEIPVLVLYPDRPVRPQYVCVFLFWFYTQTDQSDPCMSVCSCSGSIPRQTIQTLV